MPPHKLAGLFSLLAAAMLLAVWYPLLFVATPDGIPLNEAASKTFAHLLSPENPNQSWFVWLTVSPVLSACFGFLYLLTRPHSSTSAFTLFALSATHGIVAFFFANWFLAIFVALPAYWGFLSAQKA